jgi:hypothetical protein
MIGSLEPLFRLPITSANNIITNYELYDNAKCLLESGTEGGHVLVRLGNDETLGRELRTYLQTEKYVRHKNDGTLPDSSRRILRGFSD